MIDDIYDSAEGFANALDRLADQFEDEASDVMRLTVIDVSEKIKKDTPRDTGRAAAAWMLTAGQPGDGTPPESQYQTSYGGRVPANAPSPVQDPGEDVNLMWYICNNLEYISILEDGMPGGSDQAPTGMVANALNAFDQLLSDQLDGMETIEL